MKIFNLSHLFKTPVASPIETNTQNTNSKRRRRRKRTHNDSQLKSSNFCSSPDIPNKRLELEHKTTEANHPVFPAAKHKRLKTNKSDLDNLFKKSNSTTIKPSSENMKGEVFELMNSLHTLASEKETLEKKLNDLRIENEWLIKNNEDLKEELKEMTDEALELSVEKQRLLGKIGVLKKQLLNRPK